MLFSLVSSNVIWKDTYVLPYTLWQEMLLHLGAISGTGTQLLVCRLAFWGGPQHRTPCSCQTCLQPLILSQLLSYFPFYTLSSPKLQWINFYPSEFSALTQFPIFSYLRCITASLKHEKGSFSMLPIFPLSKTPGRLYFFLQSSFKS